jgi:TrmH family RNA methyltransferase
MKLKPAPKEKLKLIRALSLKKNRVAHKLFLIEGAKSVKELLNSQFDISFLLSTQTFLDQNAALLNKCPFPLFMAKVSDIERSGSLKTNNSAIAVAKIPENKPLVPNKSEYILALDDVRDPGNLGAIIRIADWYGITKLILSTNCADPYNPKTIIASMGSFTRVSFHQTNLFKYLEKSACQKIGATMEGQSIHKIKIATPAIIALGNESNGLSKLVLDSVNKTVSIPRFGHAESLNVAMAAAVICDNLKRS